MKTIKLCTDIVICNDLFSRLTKQYHTMSDHAILLLGGPMIFDIDEYWTAMM